ELAERPRAPEEVPDDQRLVAIADAVEGDLERAPRSGRGYVLRDAGAGLRLRGPGARPGRRAQAHVHAFSGMDGRLGARAASPPEGRGERRSGTGLKRREKESPRTGRGEPANVRTMIPCSGMAAGESKR